MKDVIDWLELLVCAREASVWILCPEIGYYHGIFVVRRSARSK